MIAAWFQRMNPRERKLVLLVAGVLVLLINIYIWSSLADLLGRTRTELTEQVTAPATRVYTAGKL